MFQMHRFGRYEKGWLKERIRNKADSDRDHQINTCKIVYHKTVNECGYSLDLLKDFLADVSAVLPRNEKSSNQGEEEMVEEEKREEQSAQQTLSYTPIEPVVQTRVLDPNFSGFSDLSSFLI